MIKPKIYLPDDQYKRVTDSVPIVCVDMVLYDHEQNKIGIIKRGEKYALIGGRIGLGESIDEAVRRHLNNDLGISEFQYYDCSPDRPVLVHEYDKGESANNENSRGFDPTKHSIALTFAVATNQQLKPANEANGFGWFSHNELDNIEFNFGQITVVNKVLSVFIEKS